MTDIDIILVTLWNMHSQIKDIIIIGITIIGLLITYVINDSLMSTTKVQV